MGFLKSLKDFLDEIFNKSSPEVQKRLLLRKMEAGISSFTPILYKDGVMTGNFAEAMRVLYVNTAPLLDIYSETIGSGNAQRVIRYESQLVVTGFSPATQQALDSLSFEERKKDFEGSSASQTQIFDSQKRKFDKVIAELASPQFTKIDETIITLRQFIDLCRFNFVMIIQTFDKSFSSSLALRGSYKPNYQDAPIEKLSGVFEDLYYIINGLAINNAVVNATCALKELLDGAELSNDERNSITNNIKQVAYIINHVVTVEKLKRLVCYCHEDENYSLKTQSYNRMSAKGNFEKVFQSRFTTDEERIKTQMNDEYIGGEVKKLFKTGDLITLKGYNKSINDDLVKIGLSSFLWILPMQVLKTFLSIYFNEKVRSLLNDIIIEGFFNNPSYKSEFSSDVYASIGAINTIEEFETSFDNDKPNSANVIQNYIHEGQNNSDFMRKLDKMVKNINAQANSILVREVNAMNKVYKHIVDLIQDAKKPNSEIISNLKVLMLNSRNRDNTDLLEKQYPKWEIFFKIMRSYVIINS